MKTQPETVNVPIAARAIRDEFRRGNPRGLRSIHDPWIRSALAVHSASTRYQ
jgi:hypothetical protein